MAEDLLTYGRKEDSKPDRRRLGVRAVTAALVTLGVGAGVVSCQQGRENGAPQREADRIINQLNSVSHIATDVKREDGCDLVPPQGWPNQESIGLHGVINLGHKKYGIFAVNHATHTVSWESIFELTEKKCMPSLEGPNSTHTTVEDISLIGAEDTHLSYVISGTEPGNMVANFTVEIGDRLVGYDAEPALQDR